jgi:hypothetical protein
MRVAGADTTGAISRTAPFASLAWKLDRNGTLETRSARSAWRAPHHTDGHSYLLRQSSKIAESDDGLTGAMMPLVSSLSAIFV